MNNPARFFNSFSVAYGLLMIMGLLVSSVIWSRIRSTHQIPILVFVSGLVGAMIGAKIGYIIFEWPFHGHDANKWSQLLAGRTVLGALLGGYAGVEWGKAIVGYRSATGDLFALCVPLGIAVGRIGCMIQGCCRGRTCEAAWYAIHDSAGILRYPTAAAECLFNLLMLALVIILYRRKLLPGQLFHLYLIAYCIFRLAIEHFRDSPHLGPISTYQLLAFLTLVFAAWRACSRARAIPE